MIITQYQLAVCVQFFGVYDLKSLRKYDLLVKFAELSINGTKSVFMNWNTFMTNFEMKSFLTLLHSFKKNLSKFFNFG